MAVRANDSETGAIGRLQESLVKLRNTSREPGVNNSQNSAILRAGCLMLFFGHWTQFLADELLETVTNGHHSNILLGAVHVVNGKDRQVKDIARLEESEVAEAAKQALHEVLMHAFLSPTIDRLGQVRYKPRSAILHAILLLP